MTEILCSLITGAITLIGVLVSNGKQMAVIQNEINHLAEEVKKHNSFAERIPVIENDIKTLYKRVEGK